VVPVTEQSSANALVLEVTLKLKNSLKARLVQSSKRLLPSIEDSYEDESIREVHEALVKMRRAVKAHEDKLARQAEQSARAACERLRAALDGVPVTRTFFEGTTERLGAVSLPDIIFGDLDVLRRDGDFFEEYLCSPLRELVKRLCNGWKRRIREAMHLTLSGDASCAPLEHVINAAFEKARQTLESQILDRGILRELMATRARGRLVSSVEEAQSGAYEAFVDEARAAQLDMGSESAGTLCDVICDQQRISQCRRGAIERFFQAFTGRVGSRLNNKDLFDELVLHIRDKAMGRPAVKVASGKGAGAVKARGRQPGTLFSCSRAAIRAICKANAPAGKAGDAGAGVEEAKGPAATEVDLRRLLIQAAAVFQSRLEGIRDDATRLVKAPTYQAPSAEGAAQGVGDGDPLRPSAEQHLAHQVMARTFAEVKKGFRGGALDKDRQRYYNDEYGKGGDREGVGFLRTFHCRTQASPLVDARQTPFDLSHYAFLAPPPPPAPAPPAQPPAVNKRRKSADRKGAAAAAAAAAVAAPPPQPPQPRLDELRDRLRAHDALLVDRGLLVERLGFEPEAAEAVLGDDGVSFRGGLREALAFLLLFHRGDMRQPACLAQYGQQVVSYAGSVLLSKVIFGAEAEAADEREALQRLLPVDLFVYVTALTKGQVGMHPAILDLLARGFKVNFQLWDSLAPASPPLLLGQAPDNSFTLNLVWLPVPPGEVDNLTRYGRWGVAVTRRVERDAPPRPRTTIKRKRSSGGSSGSNDGSNDDMDQGTGGTAESDGERRVRFTSS
jgi:hypothetical protein